MTFLKTKRCVTVAANSLQNYMDIKRNMFTLSELSC